jgi:hypothetical protein
MGILEEIQKHAPLIAISLGIGIPIALTAMALAKPPAPTDKCKGVICDNTCDGSTLVVRKCNPETGLCEEVDRIPNHPFCGPAFLEPHIPAVIVPGDYVWCIEPGCPLHYIPQSPNAWIYVVLRNATGDPIAGERIIWRILSGPEYVGLSVESLGCPVREVLSTTNEEGVSGVYFQALFDPGKGNFADVEVEAFLERNPKIYTYWRIAYNGRGTWPPDLTGFPVDTCLHDKCIGCVMWRQAEEELAKFRRGG